MSPATLRLRQRLGALLLAPLLGAPGCQVQNHEQRLACYEPREGESCADLASALDRLNPYRSDGCKYDDDSLSVDEGPVEMTSDISSKRSCCYLATYDNLGEYSPCLGSGRPLLGPDGPRVATLGRDHGWG